MVTAASAGLSLRGAGRLVVAVHHVALLLLTMEAILPLWYRMSGRTVDPAAGDPLTRTLLLVGYVTVFPIIVRRAPWAFRALAQEPVLLLLLLWAFASVLWSSEPGVTARRWAGACLPVLYALALTLRFDGRALLRLIGWALLVAVAGSLAMVVAMPDWGIMGYPHEGAWRGMFVHKNILGRYAALAVFFFPTLASLERSHMRVFWIGSSLLSAIVLLGSRSLSAIMLAIAGICIWLFFRTASPLHRFWLLLSAILMIAAMIAVVAIGSNYESAVTAVGRDPTLTGRIPLWLLLLEMARERIWLGYGYGAFWLGLEGPSAYVWAALGWAVPHAHNGYLDLLLDLGVIGLSLGVFLLCTCVTRLLAAYGRDPSPEVVCWLTVVAFLIGYNMVESGFLRSNSFLWILLLLAVFTSQRLSVRDRDKAVAPGRQETISLVVHR